VFATSVGFMSVLACASENTPFMKLAAAFFEDARIPIPGARTGTDKILAEQNAKTRTKKRVMVEEYELGLAMLRVYIQYLKGRVISS